MRGEHCIGAVFAVTMMIEAVDRNNRQEEALSEHFGLSRSLGAAEVAFVRLGALLHDIGHLPAGHTLEDELGLLARHDGDERISLVLDRDQWHGRSRPTLRELVDELYAPDAAELRQVDPTSGKALSASEILIRLISADHKEAVATEGSDFRLGVCRDLIGNTICADLIDYLHRDWLHIGKPKHFDPRILEYLEIRRQRPQIGGVAERLVINVRGAGRPRSDAITAILDLLESRYQLAEIALFHRVKISAAAMLERAISEFRDTYEPGGQQTSALASLVDDLLECSDQEMLKLLIQKLKEQRRKQNALRVDGAIELLRRLLVRELHRDLKSFYSDDVGGPQQAQVIANRFAGESYDDPRDALRARAEAANNRLQALRLLERDFALTPGQVVMYCPTRQMNHKIAEVGIFVNEDRVGSLVQLDKEDRTITGGYLDAQLQRFTRLWRIAFSIDRSAYQKLRDANLLPSMLDMIRLAILRIDPGIPSIDEGIQDLARRMTETPGSRFYGLQMVAPGSARVDADYVYPGGARSLAAYIAE
jgi:HD superfamily phosphohydrolase